MIEYYRNVVNQSIIDAGIQRSFANNLGSYLNTNSSAFVVDVYIEWVDGVPYIVVENEFELTPSGSIKMFSLINAYYAGYVACLVNHSS